jgi:hypothetical protein
MENNPSRKKELSYSPALKTVDFYLNNSVISENLRSHVSYRLHFASPLSSYVRISFLLRLCSVE